MDFTLSIGETDGILRVRTSGRITAEDYRRLNAAIRSNAGRKPGMPLLMDHRELEDAGISPEDIRSITRMSLGFNELGEGTRVATVVETDLGFGLARMRDSNVEARLRPEHRIFRSCAEAERWLTGLDQSDSGEG